MLYLDWDPESSYQFAGNLGQMKKEHDVGLHWRVPFIEVLSETVQVVW